MQSDKAEAKSRRLLPNLLLSAASFLAMFVVLEIGARVLLMNFLDEKQFFEYASVNQLAKKSKVQPQLYQKYSPHRYIGFYPNPGFSREKQSHNSLGYRGAEFEQPKPPGEFRIVCVGGSTTYTEYNFDDELTYPYLLNKTLHERGFTKVNVINAGFNGYATWESLVNLEFRVLDLDPDLIIIHHAINDVGARIIWPPEDFKSDNSGWRIPRFTDVFMPPWYEHSTLVRIALVRLGFSQSHNALQRRADSNSASYHTLELVDQMHKGTYPSGIFETVSVKEMLDTNTPKYFRRNMEHMVALAKLRNVDVVLATLAWSSDFEKEWVSLPEVGDELAEHNHITRNIAVEMDVHLFDFASVFPSEKQYFVDGRHMNAEGARLKGDLFADYMAESGLLPEARVKSAAPSSEEGSQLSSTSVLVTDDQPTSKIANGGFEYFGERDTFPLDWGGLLHAPTAEPEETIRRSGQRSVKLTGLKDQTTALKAMVAPTLDEVRGKKVTFSAWVYSSSPKSTSVAIIYDWSSYKSAKPTRRFQWQLSEVTATIPEDATFLHFAISIGASGDPVVCYVDDAALFITEEASPDG